MEYSFPKWKVIEHYDKYHCESIDINGKANKYGKPKLFNREVDAWEWIKKHSYKGMSSYYSVKKVERNEI